MKSERERSELYARDRDEWRRWLEANHETASGIELVYYKVQVDKPSVSYEEAVEEAICFGWIDSKVTSIDEERYKQRYTPRRAGSIWSRSNKDRVERMIAERRVTPAGLAAVERAKQDGSWTSLDDAENLVEPDLLTDALDADPAARRGYDAYPDSWKKSIIYWITSAKRDATKQRRVVQTVKAAGNGRHPVTGEGIPSRR